MATTFTTSGCAQVIFGGRNDIGYFSDVWAYRLSTASWEDWTPGTVKSSAPLGRDHFGAVYNAGHIYIYGMFSTTSSNECYCQLYTSKAGKSWVSFSRDLSELGI